MFTSKVDLKSHQVADLFHQSRPRTTMERTTIFTHSRSLLPDDGGHGPSRLGKGSVGEITREKHCYS